MTAARSPSSALECFCRLLVDGGVEFIVVGGQAEVLWGSPRDSRDIDLCYRYTPENRERLARVLETLRLKRLGPPGYDIEYTVEGRSLVFGPFAGNMDFRVDDDYDVDLLYRTDPIGTYDDLLPRARTMGVGARSVLVMGLDDLLRVRRHFNRPWDRASLAYLEALALNPAAAGAILGPP